MKIIFIVFFIIITFNSCKHNAPTEYINNNTLFNDTLFVGGTFSKAGDQNVNNIAMWDGSNWHSVGTGLTGQGAEIESMIIYQKNLYVGGFFDSAGGKEVSNIAKWNGQEWSTVGSGINGRVTCFAIYNNELYVGGWFSIAGGIKADNIAKWNGLNWSSVGEGFSDEIYTLVVYRGNLYAGGWFTKNTVGYVNADNIAQWNGTKWNSVKGGIKGNIPGGSWVNNLSTFNNELYAMGNFTWCDGINVSGIAKWNDTIWTDVGRGVSPLKIYTAAEYQDELHIGGEFDSVGNISSNYYAIWNGKEWFKGNLTMDASPACIYSFNSNLYFGGLFKSVNGLSVNGIFKWNGNKIYPLNKGVNGHVYSIIGF